MQQLSYGNYGVLASSGDLTQPPYNLRLDNQVVTEWVDLWESDDADPLSRGNRKRLLTLSVPRLFSSHKLAHENFLTHADALDDAGAMTATCGLPGDQSTRAADAVLQSAVPELRGLTVIWHYTFLCGPFATPST